MTPEEQSAVRDWVVNGLTLIIDNYEPWYIRVNEAAARAKQTDGARGIAVVNEIHEIIEEEASGEVLNLLLELLDLDDSTQAAMLGKHYDDAVSVI